MPIESCTALHVGSSQLLHTGDKRLLIRELILRHSSTHHNILVGLRYSLVWIDRPRFGQTRTLQTCHMAIVLCIPVPGIEYLLSSPGRIVPFIVDDGIQMGTAPGGLHRRAHRRDRPGLIALLGLHHDLLHVGIHVIIILWRANYRNLNGSSRKRRMCLAYCSATSNATSSTRRW